MPAFYISLLGIFLGMLDLREGGPNVLPPFTTSNDAVVVELFTSQGCSSCPPADRLLSKLGNDERLAGKVIPLSFHVDYWNHIGWTDPFSQKSWSQRQQNYAASFKSARIYTPQMVVNGRSEFVGSDEKRALAEIRSALAQPAGVKLRAELTKNVGDEIELRIRAESTDEIKSQTSQVLVAVFERGLTTSVKSGENARRTLHNDFVVRMLERAFKIFPQAAASPGVVFRLKLNPSWKREHLGIAVFAQDETSMAIYGATALDLQKRLP